VINSPDPPSSFGKSLNFGTPSFIGRTISLIVDVDSWFEVQLGDRGVEDVN
jgi:hypothetical protein